MIPSTIGDILKRKFSSTSFHKRKEITWKISAPFIYRIELYNPSINSIIETSFREVFAKISPYAHEILLTCDEPVEHPAVFSILEFLDKQNISWHLQTSVPWENPHFLLSKLRQFRNLNTLRIVFPFLDAHRGATFPKDHSYSESFIKNIRMAVACGLNICSVTPLIQETIENLNPIAMDARDLGVNGMIFSRHALTAQLDKEILCSGYRDIRQLYETGYPVAIEDCPPPGVDPGAVPHCKGSGSCFVDKNGNVSICRNSDVIIGNLFEDKIDQLWNTAHLRTLYLKYCSFGNGKRKCDLPFKYNDGLEQASTLKVNLTQTAPLSLDGNLCPVKLFWFRPEPFGAILVKGHFFVPVLKRGAEIAAAIDGQRDLVYFKRKFGREAVEFIYALFCQKMIRLERRISPDIKRTSKQNTNIIVSNNSDNGRSLQETFSENDFIITTPNLYFSRRGTKMLIVEPETASWCVLSQPEWDIFRRIGPLSFTGQKATNTIGKQVAEIHFQDQLGTSEFQQLLLRLSRRNMISVNGICYYQPTLMWGVQDYPHYYNLHMTEACNLACRYCLVDSPRKAPMMSPETCRMIVRRTLEEIPLREVSVGFHGGEPLLNLRAVEAGAREACSVAARLGKSVSLSLQTNGTMLSDRVAATLKDLNINVGVSIDGPQHIHDKQRIFRSGKGSHCAVNRGLLAAAKSGLWLSYLAVVHNPENYVRVLDYLVREKGAGSLRINYSSFEGRAKYEMEFSLDRAAAFSVEWLKMIDYARAYFEETGIWLDIDDVNVFIFHLLSKMRPHMCYRSPCGAGNSIIGFGSDGQMYLCDEVVGNPFFRIGSILDDASLSTLLDNSPVKKGMMTSRKVENVSKCSSCTWRRFHGAGCLSKSYAAFGQVDKDDPMCFFYRTVFEELMWRLWENPELSYLTGRYSRWLNVNEIIRSLHM